MSDIKDEILSRRQAAQDHFAQKRVLWDDIERLFHSQLTDTKSAQAKSQVFDPKLSTLLLERSYRVMAQLGTGKVRGISENDIGKATLKNLILEKYVIPNANSQFDFLTKLRMVDLYSNMYGAFFVLVDWNVGRNGYMGPDMWMLNIRDVFPQVGAVSLEDSDYVIVRTWKPLSYFEGLKKADGFKNVEEIVTKLKAIKDGRGKREANDTSKREDSQYPRQVDSPKGYFEVLTQYERDRWVDFCVDADMEFRDQPNPHDDGDLPVKAKYSIPLLDDFMGMGDMERGKPMQMVVNSNWNLYLDGVALSHNPPVAIDKGKIASNSSIQYIPGAKWMFRDLTSPAVQALNLNPQGIQTFNNVHQVANASILNMFGTSDTTVTSQTDPGMGKTPDAIKMQAARENTRDNADRFYMEQFTTSVMKKFVTLICKKQTSDVTIRMFGDEVERLRRSFPEIDEYYDEANGKLKVGKDDKETLYDYELVSGSTYAADHRQQQENLAMLLKMYQGSQTPQGNMLVSDLAREGYNFKFGELFKNIVSNSGIQDWDRILEEQTPEEKDDQVIGDHAAQLQAAIQQMMGNPGATPVQPEMQPQAPPQMPPEANGMGGAF